MSIRTTTPGVVLEVLTKAADLIRGRERWTTGTLARDKRNAKVAPYSGDAVQWCAQGAVECIVVDEHGPNQAMIVECMRQLEVSVAAVFGCSNVASYNDNRGHTEIIKVFDATIARIRLLSPKYLASKKGWETRRKNMAAQAGVAGPSGVMTFGGTITTATTADPVEEEDRVLA